MIVWCVSSVWPSFCLTLAWPQPELKYDLDLVVSCPLQQHAGPADDADDSAAGRPLAPGAHQVHPPALCILIVSVASAWHSGLHCMHTKHSAFSWIAQGGHQQCCTESGSISMVAYAMFGLFLFPCLQSWRGLKERLCPLVCPSVHSSVCHATNLWSYWVYWLQTL